MLVQSAPKLYELLKWKVQNIPNPPFQKYLWKIVFGYGIEIKSIENYMYNITLVVKIKSIPRGINLKEGKNTPKFGHANFRLFFLQHSNTNHYLFINSPFIHIIDGWQIIRNIETKVSQFKSKHTNLSLNNVYSY